jgi:hypothetical protein
VHFFEFNCNFLIVMFKMLSILNRKCLKIPKKILSPMALFMVSFGSWFFLDVELIFEMI